MKTVIVEWSACQLYVPGPQSLAPAIIIADHDEGRVSIL